jgi:hypothetical protein
VFAHLSNQHHIRVQARANHVVDGAHFIGNQTLDRL